MEEKTQKKIAEQQRREEEKNSEEEGSANEDENNELLSHSNSEVSQGQKKRDSTVPRFKTSEESFSKPQSSQLFNSQQPLNQAQFQQQLSRPTINNFDQSSPGQLLFTLNDKNIIHEEQDEPSQMQISSKRNLSSVNEKLLQRQTSIVQNIKVQQINDFDIPSLDGSMREELE